MNELIGICTCVYVCVDALAASAADNEMMSPEAQQVVLRLICDTSVRLGDGQVTMATPIIIVPHLSLVVVVGA